MLRYANSLMQKVSAFPHLSLAWVKSICLLLLLEGRRDYGRKVPFVQPKAVMLSVQGFDMLEKLKIISQFHYLKRQGSFGEKCLFPTRIYGTVEGLYLKFISVGPEALKYLCEHKAT